MAYDNATVLCGKCKVNVEGPSEPKPQDTFSCPSCGNSDTFENIVASCQRFYEDTVGKAFQNMVANEIEGEKGLNFKPDRIPKRIYPFIIDYEVKL